MRIGALLLLTGCQNLFGLRNVPADGRVTIDAHDAAAAGSDAVIPDGPRSIDAAAPPSTALIQEAISSDTGTGIDVSFPIPPASGHTLILIGGATCGMQAPVGGGVSGWTSAAASVVSPTVYLFFGTTNGSSGSVHLSPICPGPVQMWGLLTEWTGVMAEDDNQSEGMAGAQGSISLAVTPSATPDLLVFGASYYGSVMPPTAGMWTEMSEILTAGPGQRAWYELVNSTTMQTVDSSYTNDFDAVLVAFRAQ